MVKMFKMINGEFVISEVKKGDERTYLLEYPAIIVPQQQGQIGFGKYMPFSDYGEEILLNRRSISVESAANTQMTEAYENWKTQVKAQESGLIVPNRTVPQEGKDFSKLNM